MFLQARALCDDDPCQVDPDQLISSLAKVSFYDPTATTDGANRASQPATASAPLQVGGDDILGSGFSRLLAFEFVCASRIVICALSRDRVQKHDKIL